MCNISATEDEIILCSLAEEKIATGKKLISALDEFKQICGIIKIQKKITSEIIYLQKVSRACICDSFSPKSLNNSGLMTTGNIIEELKTQ